MDALNNQVVDAVGGLGTPFDVRPGDAGGQPRISHDRFHDAIQAGIGAG